MTSFFDIARRSPPTGSKARRWNPLNCRLRPIAILLLFALPACDRDNERRTNLPSQANGTATETQSGQQAQASSVPTASGIRLTDVTANSNIDFVHFYDGQGGMYIAEEVASGMASFDYDRDGLIDLYFLKGTKIPFDGGGSPPNALYRNLGNMRFANATQQSHADDTSFSVGVVAADFDSDGFPDIFVNNFGPKKLYRNNGDGTFSDVTEIAGVGCGNRLGAGACFLDADQDGFLDLYVGNYVKSPIEKNVKRTTDAFPSYPGPLDFEPERDFYFRNRGDGTFEDQSDASGVSQIATPSMGVISTDFDDDGDPDVLVVNDVERNLLWENNGKGQFTEVGINRGIAFSRGAKRNGNMGVDCGDYNNDGFIDVYTSTFSNDFPVLYKNDGAGNFEDITLASNAGAGMFPHANWGVAFFDAENDGYQDLFIANGHTDPNVNKWAPTTAWKVRNSFLRNLGNGRFADLSKQVGSGMEPVESSRGLIADDLDNDGNVDLVVLNSLAQPTVIRNESTNTHHWLQLELLGKSATRDGTGSKVHVQAGGNTFVSEVYAGRGYQSSFGQRLHFGLGEASTIEKITIRWSDGQVQVIEEVKADQLLKIVQVPEGSSG